ncbi:N-acyl homoserine lactonase family protein [Oricola sp.]|uniref:N-acyl homoserine lactonase family protein n=1 Tax=Oricola sp. TaxID=1979950 RepID=UPI0025D73F43|nr:N-acyl homoserine lactonase family protein [Oricola sp.]MCI5075391.1 N-acyl homoserine lactonase family protein [Oricola sp.]
MDRRIFDTLPECGAAPGLWEIYALRYARMPERRIHENFLRRDMHDGPMPLDFFVWIARSRDRTVLIDTGYGHRAGAERGRPVDIEPAEALARIGLPPERIEHVILTHLHYDHAGSLDQFPNARIHLQDAEIAYATGRSMCHHIARFPYDVEDVVHFVRRVYGEQVDFHEGDATLFPGLSLHLLPGHAKGLQGVLVETARGPVLIASDAAHTYANLTENHPFSLTIDVDATLNTYRRIRELARDVDHVIPGHDALVRAYYPAITVAGIELQVLHVSPKTP